jgi:formate hydrogenlyase transcriptional activator
LGMFIFFIFPPVGFIINERAPYSLQIDLKRIFNNSFNFFFPWFIYLYTGYGKKTILYSIDALLLLSYIAMVFTKTESPVTLWVLLVLIVLASNLVYGFYAGMMQLKKSDKKNGRWLIIAMSFYAVLFLLTVINQLGNGYFSKLLGTPLFFPINLFPLSFMVIMGIRLRENIFEKYKLQKILRWGDNRWDSVVENMQLLIVELDDKGIIKYINPYAIKALGYQSAEELIDKNWFDSFIPTEEIERRKSLHRELLKDGKLLPNWTSHTLTKNGAKLIINWTNVFIYNNKSGITGTMSIGLNISEQENALEEVQSLKIELAKEDLTFKEEFGADEPDIIGNSEAILYAIQKTRQVASTNATVLLEGETGVGKELFANLIHKHSNRSKKTLIKINCAALPPELIESELFGHEKGSFTGALQARKGRFELANEGTIFLDEIGELPLPLQSKLLRVLQNGEFERIGGQETIKVDVRVISATNRDLLQEVRSSRFREDLYYRLNVYPITIPPLRNRKEDISLLVKHFVKKFSDEHHKQIDNISKGDMIRLNTYPWPGNIRELINVIHRSIISSKGSTLKLDWLNNSSAETPVAAFSIEEVERAHILKVLKDCNGKINGGDGAAIKLGLNPNTLRSRMKKLNISRTEF